MTTLGFLALAATVTFAAFVQGATGLGFAMISAPVFTLLDPGLIPVSLLILMIPLSAYVAHREREGIHWRGVAWLSVGRAAGAFGGLWILLVITPRGLGLLIGWTTLLAVAAAAIAPAFHPNRRALAFVGAISGVTETATGVGGPPVALAYQHSPGATMRSTVAITFLIGQVVSLGLLAPTGLIGAHTLKITATLMPFLALGAFLSRFVHHRLDGALLRWLVLGFSAAAGAVVLLTA